MYKQKKNQVHHLILLALCQIVLMKNLMKKESNKNWTTCLRLNTEDGSPRVFLLNSHFLGSVPESQQCFFLQYLFVLPQTDDVAVHFAFATIVVVTLKRRAVFWKESWLITVRKVVHFFSVFNRMAHACIYFIRI